MLLRNNKLLKFFAILLFVFELIAPSILQATAKEMVVESGEQICITHTHLGFLSYLLIEEKGEEEREGKNLLISSIDFRNGVSPLQARCSPTVKITPIHQKISFDTHPPLYKLFDSFRL